MSPAESFEISPSTIDALTTKVANFDYGKYLLRVNLKTVRGFTDVSVDFDFPVTALIGPNGGGKTTVLGAAALAYKTVRPSRFFARGGTHDPSMVNWSLDHIVLDKTLEVDGVVNGQSVNYPSSKWNRRPFDREVVVLGIARTVPATERRDLRLATSGQFRAATETALSPAVETEVARILGKPIAGYTELLLTKGGSTTLLTGKDSASGDGYTEFHFGAGEASLIRIVTAVENASTNALILIEEIENGLHPLATRRLVEYLIAVAKKKSCQVIFTTHSDAALKPLPEDAIWAAVKGAVIQGTPSIEALKAMSDVVADTTLVVYVEDDFTVELMRKVLVFSGVDLNSVAVHKMGGADNAILMNRSHNADPSTNVPSAAFIDGDERLKGNPAESVYVFPGDDDPEDYIFDVVKENFDAVAIFLAAGMGLPETIVPKLKEIVLTHGFVNRDRHVIFEHIAGDLGMDKQTVARAFISTWAQLRPAEIKDLVAPISAHLAITVTPVTEATAASAT